MCGITGYVGLDDEAVLRAMCTSLRHRGPDDEGYFIAPNVGLAMRRLAIIDLRTGHQPISNEGGDVHVVLNGEIYNYQELTERLKRSGHRFSTTSDTETIVHLYEEKGLDFVSELRGMFAIALWDARCRRLVLARDRVGEKPLYYKEDDGRLLFGSEIKAILQAGVPRRPDHQAICDFLALGYVPPPRSFFQDISKLAPGQMLVWENGRSHTRFYWDRESRSILNIGFDAAARQLGALLGEVVRLCLKSDVEVGAFLSGGIDSSVLVALMRERGVHVQTFSVGYGGAAAGFNELNYARRVATELGTEHHELILSARSTMDLLPRILWHYDEPHGEPTSVLVYLLCRFTRKWVKAAIGGTGGDEIFFGYPRHAAVGLLQYYHLIPRLLREQVVERIVMRFPESTRGSRFAKRAKRFVKGAGLPPPEAYAGWVSLLDAGVRDQLLSAETRAAAAQPAGDAYLRAVLTDPRRGSLLERAASLDVNGYLPEYQLAYMDRMSMAHGLEVRSPLCDYRLVDFVTSLPTSYRLRGTRTKHILKSIASAWIPGDIVERRKVGFDSPIGQWVKKDLRDFITRFLAPEQVARSGLLDPGGVQKILADHLSGSRDYSLQLWSILALEAWHRMYIEDRVTDGEQYTLSDLRGAAAQTASCSQPGAARSAPCPPWPKPPAARRNPLPRLAGLRRRVWDKTPRILRTCLSPLLDRLSPALLLGRDFRRWLSFAEESQDWDVERSREYQLSRLQWISRLAYDRSAFYRQWFDGVGFHPGDLKTLDDFRHLPVISRRTVMENLEQMCTVSPRCAGADRVSTGGTNGAPLTFYIDAGRSAMEYAFLVASWRRIGYSPDLPTAVFRGRVVAADRSGLHHEFDPVLRAHYYSSFHMTDGDMERYIEHLRTLGPCFLHVYPSTVFALAHFIGRKGVKAPTNVRGIIAESEISYPNQRRIAERTFRCRYFSCYGHSEKLVLGAGCEESDDYHIWPTYGYFELLDDHGNPVNRPGERGEIVGSGFMNTVVPFIRYRTGDYAVYVGERCPACNRRQPLIRDIRGHRVQEMLVLSDGTELSWTALNMHDDTFHNVRHFQFRQEAPGRAVLLLVPGAGFEDADRRRIVRNLDRKLEGRLALTINVVESIPLSPRGKAIYVDQRIKRFALMAR